MKNRTEIIAVIGVAIALAALQIGLFAWLRDDISKLSTRIGIVEQSVVGIKVEVDRIAGIEREVASGKEQRGLREWPALCRVARSSKGKETSNRRSRVTRMLRAALRFMPCC